MDRCDACDFVYDELPAEDAAELLRSLPARYADLLRAAVDSGLARRRPAPEVWSALEYTCHVRDVLQVQRERLLAALTEDRPAFAPMGRDELVIERRYNDQNVEAVLTELADAAGRFAADLDALDEDGWRRTGIYNWPEQAERTMAWLARHTVHEGIHHLDDIVAGLDRVRSEHPETPG